MEKRKSFRMRDVLYMIRNWLVGDGEESRISDDKELWNCLSEEMKKVFGVLEKEDMELVMIRIWVREGVGELGYGNVKSGIGGFVKEWNKEGGYSDLSIEDMENGLCDLVFS